MREWRCRACDKHLVNYDVLEGSVALERICPRCGARNVEVISVRTVERVLTATINEQSRL